MASVAVPEHALAVLVISRIVGEVLTGLHVAYPRGVLPIPGHSLRQAGIELDRRRPACLAHQLRAGKGVAAVMSRAILDGLDEARPHTPSPPNLLHNAKVRQRAVTPRVI